MNQLLKTRLLRFGTSAALILIFATAVTSVRVSTAPQAPAGTAVRAVPWFGQESQPHQVYSGGQLTLQAVFGLPDGTPVSASSATWDPGDGSPVVTVSAANPRAIERVHTYTGTDGQPFVATVTVKDTFGATYTDTFRVVIRANTRETRVNMAIDKALWNLHKSMQLTTVDGLPAGRWVNQYSSYYMATTAGVMQAFGINNHREGGDPNVNPYVANTIRGMRYVLSQSGGALLPVTIGNQTAPTTYAATAPWPTPVTSPNNPDSNGNGIGLRVQYGSHESYLGGQLMDALVVMGNPNKLAETGNASVKNRTYREILRDMQDGYAWGMYDPLGGWYYTYNQAANDTSASHWWAIGTLAGQVWGVDAQDWVKNLQWNVGVPLMQAAPGENVNGCYFGYTNSKNNWNGDNQMNVTAAGLIMLNADGVPQSHPRYQCGMKWLNTYFNNQLGNFYTMYQLAKAMRTAIDDNGDTTPITLLNGTRDWYAAYADHLVSTQQPSGALVSTTGGIGTGYILGDMSTSWGVIILSPSLFELPPTAACSVDASVVCQAGAPGGCNATGGDIYATVNFSGSASTAGDNAIATYDWNFQDGNSATGVTAAHQFSSVGTFNVALTVTDTKGISSTVSCPVRVTSTAVPPVANAGGPYDVCPNRAPSVILNGRGSLERGSEIVSYEWDWTSPLNFVAPNATTEVTDQTAYFAALPLGSYDVGLRITDDTPANEGGPFTSTAFTVVTVRAASDPRCNAAPEATANAYTTQKNQPVSGNVRTDGIADFDPDGDTFTAAVVAGPVHGTLNFANGAFIYTPPMGFDGTVTFTYRLTDQFGGISNTATVTIIVLPNVDPVANPDTASTYSGTPVTVTVLTNDSDADDGQTLTVTGTSGGPANGTVTVNGDGTITYTPNLGFAGTDTFTYAISDGNGGTASATVTVTVAKRLATVTAGSGTKVFGEADPVLTPTSTGFLDGITVSQTPRDAGESVGTYATHATAAGDTLDNYSVTYADGTLTITQAAPTASATGGTFTYDGQPHGGTCTVAGANGEVLPGVISYSSGGEPVSAGTHTVTCSFAGDHNYTAATAEATIVINRAVASVTANSYTRSYLAPDPAFAGVLGGFVAGDNISATYSSTGAGSQVPGVYPTVPSLVDPDGKLANYAVTSNNGTLTITNTAPVCVIAPSITSIWPPNHKMVSVTASGATDVDGGPLTYSVVSIFQDEPTNTNGDGNTAIDGAGIGTSTAQVRAERTGDPKNPGNGRVYHITFSVTDSLGLSCEATVKVGVPHDQSGRVQPIDGGPLFDSTVAGPPPAATSTGKGKGN